MLGGCRAHPDTSAEVSCARCGDFLCGLCAPQPPESLCDRCALRGVVEWEVRAEGDALRALWATWREAVTSPRALGARLSGRGQLGHAFAYGVCTLLLGTLPLCLGTAALLLTVVDPMRLGLRSTSVLSTAVFVALLAPLLATLVPSLLFAWAALLSLLCAFRVRFDVLARGSTYAFGLVAIPLLGPLLAPVALLQAISAAHGKLTALLGFSRASVVLLGAVGLIAVLAGLLAYIVG